MLRAQAQVRASLTRLAPHPLHTTRHAPPSHTYHHFSSIRPLGASLLTVQPALCGRRGSSHNSAWFHSTPMRQSVPVFLAAVKASTMIEFARTAGRIALTLVPFIIVKNRWARRFIKHHDRFHGTPISEEKKAALLGRVRSSTVFVHFLLFVPVALLWLGVLASAERTPLTGRWRLIVLSPEEEDEIAAGLAGPRWHQAVTDILSSEGSAKLIPTRDWRYQWVQDTLNRLESVIPMLQHEHELNTRWLDVGPDQPPLPPPAEYPLRPRPRATDCLRRYCDSLSGRKSTPSAHVIAGPPYSLLIADRPDAANAFSYGFGPHGACGIVVYSGFLDDVLSKAPAHGASDHTPATPRLQGPSWLSYLFGSLRGVSPTAPTTPSHAIPTEEQTAELAILLAHEVAHLMLSHHIETLSSATIIWPAIMSMLADMTRTLMFPVTMFFGPFFNDAIAQAGKVGSGHLTELGGNCTSVKQEIEADVVSARLLAHAGFDARKAVAFWESREEAAKPGKCSSATRSVVPPDGWNPARQIMGASHPVHQERIERLKSELVRWELEKRVAVKKRAEGKPSERTWAHF